MVIVSKILDFSRCSRYNHIVNEQWMTSITYDGILKILNNETQGKIFTNHQR